MHPYHAEIVSKIKKKAGAGTKYTSSETYLGNNHPTYAITAPVLRTIAKDFMRDHATIEPSAVVHLITSLVHGESFTEKCIAGMLLDYLRKEQRDFEKSIFANWLVPLRGWAEVDSLCTGKFQQVDIPLHFANWKPLLKTLAVSNQIEQRRASLVLLCSPLSHSDDSQLAKTAFDNIDLLKEEKEILITKAISWLLRSMIRHHREAVEHFLGENAATLPKIAVRETTVKLQTGTKTKKKSGN